MICSEQENMRLRRVLALGKDLQGQLVLFLNAYR